MKTLVAQTTAQWRQWLDAHHATASEVWLVFYKRGTGQPTIEYEDAVCEALCFGWVDSLIKRLDDARYARKFTPRKADSRWSPSNRRRYAALKASGRLTAAGIERAPNGRVSEAPRVPARVPAYIQSALGKHPAAWREFERLPPSHRRRYVGWIDCARRPETKARRLAEAIHELTAGTPLGLK